MKKVILFLALLLTTTLASAQGKTLVSNWLATLNFQTSTETSAMNITIDNQTQRVTLADNTATRALVERLQEGPVTITLNSSGGFEIWGPLGFSLPTSNQQMTAQPGDVVLYNGSNICLFYGSNSWSYTRLGKIDGLSESQLRTFLKAGESNITATLSLTSDATGIGNISSNHPNAAGAASLAYTQNGVPASASHKGIVIKDGKKFVR